VNPPPDLSGHFPIFLSFFPVFPEVLSRVFARSLSEGFLVMPLLNAVQELFY
jgi:hypothetical protein